VENFGDKKLKIFIFFILNIRMGDFDKATTWVVKKNWNPRHGTWCGKKKTATTKVVTTIKVVGRAMED